jgi:hypothetical protein
MRSICVSKALTTRIASEGSEPDMAAVRAAVRLSTWCEHSPHGRFRNGEEVLFERRYQSCNLIYQDEYKSILISDDVLNVLKHLHDKFATLKREPRRPN